MDKSRDVLITECLTKDDRIDLLLTRTIQQAAQIKILKSEIARLHMADTAAHG